MAYKFWMVKRVTGGRYGFASSCEHTTEVAADKEARRLAVANPGQEFAVLVATKTVKAPEPYCEWDVNLKTAEEIVNSMAPKVEKPQLCPCGIVHSQYADDSIPF